VEPVSDIRPRVVDSLATHGTSSGSPVVYVHGSMDRQAAFARTIRHVPDVRSIVYDRRGYARSVEVPPPYTVAANALDLVEVIESIGVRVRAVGHSFGGVTVLAAASRRPELFEAIAIYESPMSWQEWWPSSTGGSAAVASANDPGAAAELFLKRFIGDERWERLPQRTKNSRRREGRALVGELSDLRREPAYELSQIRVPVVSAVGSRAGEHVKRAAGLIAEACSPIPVVELDGGWHNAPSTSPEAFADLVVRRLLTLGS